MAKFVFQFEAVLMHRSVLQQQKQRALAELDRQRLEIERQLRELQQEISADKHQMAGALVGSVDVSRIRQHARHVGRVGAFAQQAAVKLLGLHRQIDVARATLLEATKAKKAIELLKDRQLLAWRQALDKREASELDELATQSYARQAAEVAP